MKKIFLVASIITLYPAFCFGQWDSINSHRGFISINGGITFPCGGFEESSINAGKNNYSGVEAGNGETFNLTFAKPITRLLTLEGKLCFHSNGYEDAGGSNSIYDVQEYDNGSTSYQEYSALFGLMISTYGIHVLMDFRILIGPMRYSFPEIRYYPYSTIGPYIGYLGYYIDIKSEQGTTLAFDLGWSMRFPISKKLFIPVDLDFYYSGYTYNIAYTEIAQYSNLPYFSLPPKNWFIPVSLVNLTAGIGYEL